ncbi:MAG: hypothetical protein ACERKJ_02405 [Candidatus Dadabacteria bacterium]
MPWISDRFVKNCIITSFLVCSILVGVFSYSHLTFAQPVFEISNVSPVIVPIEDSVLWDQSDNVSDTNIVSQDFLGVIFDTHDARAADDFLVPDGILWSIETVKVFGLYSNIPALSLDVVFFRDEGGFPGSKVDGCNFLNILPVEIDNPNFLINLPTPCVLRPGTYWMSVRANMLFLQHGQWWWYERTVQTLNPFVWENPLDGFDTGCTTFSYAQAECGADFPDLTFQLIGQEQLFPVVPALNTIGLITLFITLGFVLVVYFRRMKRQQSFK